MATNGAYLFRQGTSPQTSTIQSSRIRIFATSADGPRFQKVGVTSTFGISESRGIEVVRGLGFGDQIAELVPGPTQPMSINITRAALYVQNLMQAFGYKAGMSGAVRSLKHHKWPFDIKVEIVLSEYANENPNNKNTVVSDSTAEGGLNNAGNPGLMALITVFEACWMESYSTDYGVDTAVVTENCSCQASDVYDTVSNYGDFIISGLSNASGNTDNRSLRFTS
jgi:hypothetical protein